MPVWLSVITINFLVTMTTMIIKLTQRLILIVFVSAFFFQPSFANNVSRKHLIPITATITAAIGNAELSGFNSIPLGGAVGTASSRRPTLAEVGIKRTTIYDVSLLLSTPTSLRLYGNYEYLRPNGRDVLTQNLLFHGLWYPVDSAINSATKYDLYEVGIDYPWYFSLHNFSIAPAIEFAAVNFTFALHSIVAQSTRSFVQGTGCIGLHANYDFSQALSLSVVATSSIPHLTNLDVANLGAKINYNFMQYQLITAGLFASIAYQRISFRDHQTLPNNIRLIIAPVAAVGMVVSF